MTVLTILFRAAAALTLLLPGACMTAFAPRQADLMREPPPFLATDTDAFWNDRQSGTYGQFTVGARLYRFPGGSCRTARVTSIDTVSREQRDQLLLYCAAPDGRFTLVRDLTCRDVAGSARISCRDSSGSRYETLDPA